MLADEDQGKCTLRIGTHLYLFDDNMEQVSRLPHLLEDLLLLVNYAFKKLTKHARKNWLAAVLFFSFLFKGYT